MTPQAPKKHRRIRLIFALLALVSLRRAIQRPGKEEAEPSWSRQPDEESRLSQAAHPGPSLDQETEPEPKPEPPPQTVAERNAEIPEEPTPDLDPAEIRYAVKWVDGSDGADVPHEKRDLTLKQAQREAGWLAKHNRRFYLGEAGERSPFSHLQVWLQCPCGRDVVDLREPHTVPGENEICPYSDSAQGRHRDVILASR